MIMKKITWKQKFQYKFDNIMSKGTISLIGILFLITLLVVAVSGIIVGVMGQTGMGVGKSIWVSLMHAIDAGTLAGDDGDIVFILLMTIVTVCGLFITSMLISILNAGVEEKMTSLQKGKSIVLEKNQTVLLGFNENALNILSELILANENQKDEVVVVMDDIDKTTMEDMIHQRIPDSKTTRIICRSGRIDSFSDLSICSLETCRSVILNIEDDAQTIKAILACVNILEKSDNQDAYVVAMIREKENLKAAQIAGGNRAEILYFKRTIARLLAHASRHPGISNVFTNLLSYEGDEIYVEPLQGSIGKTMEQINMSLPDSIAIGIVKNGVPMVNPPRDVIVEKNDALILLEEDDGVAKMQPPVQADVSKFAAEKKAESSLQHTLILGNGELLGLVLSELDNYAAPGSRVVVANNEWKEKEEIVRLIPLKNIVLEQKTCDIFSSQVLEELVQCKPENVMILTDASLEDEKADANTLLLLLQLSNISEKTGIDFTVASEMRKVENQELAKVTKVNDFVVSSNITALMMTQISQIRQQRLILEDLLDEDGSEFYRKPISRYVSCGVPVDFYTMSAAAARYGEIAIGYQIVNGRKLNTVCNPNKKDTIVFKEEDALIVIAED